MRSVSHTFEEINWMWISTLYFFIDEEKQELAKYFLSLSTLKNKQKAIWNKRYKASELIIPTMFASYLKGLSVKSLGLFSTERGPSRLQNREN